MKLSVNTDFMGTKADVSEPLKLISEAGFKYIHWCHHWSGDFQYSYYEIKKIKRLLQEYGLQLYDLHASHGSEKYWCSRDETARLAGQELLLNRIQMTHELGGRAIVLHPNTDPLSDITKKRAEQGVRTLTALEPYCRELGIRIALENLFDNNGDAAFYDLNRYLSQFPADYIGFCWDCGHSNMVTNGIGRVKPLTQRLVILHLSDNNGKKDQHLPMGDGNVGWNQVADIIAASPYDGALTQELNLPQGSMPHEFLLDIMQRGNTFASKIEALRGQSIDN